MSIINKDYIRDVINQSAAWSVSHGSDEHEYMGAGLLYYSLVYMLRANLCVCLGSGGGFVPRIMRQAQRDLGMPRARTILVDANQGDWGRPQWLDGDSFFRSNFPDIEIILGRTLDVAERYAGEWKIDYLHLDADHSHEASLRDFQAYKSLMADDGVITFHDTYGEIPCVKTLDDVRAEGHDVVDFPNIGGGFAMIRLRSQPKSPDA